MSFSTKNMLVFTTFDSRLSTRGVGGFCGLTRSLNYTGYFGFYFLIILILTTFFDVSDFRPVIDDIIMLSRFPTDFDNFIFSYLTSSSSCFVSPSS